MLEASLCYVINDLNKFNFLGSFSYKKDLLTVLLPCV